MALEKITYVDRLTKIPAYNMNQIQDEVIRNKSSYILLSGNINESDI